MTNKEYLSQMTSEELAIFLTINEFALIDKIDAVLKNVPGNLVNDGARAGAQQSWLEWLESERIILEKEKK